MNDINTREYVRFLNEIKLRIILARAQAFQPLNKELAKLYWDIARSIIEQQEKYKWGDAQVEKLVSDLKEDFKSTFGFSVHSLWSLCQGYLKYKKAPVLQYLVKELPY